MNKDTLEKLKPFLYGKLLGDANLEKTSKSRKNSRLKLEHSIKQENYILHCYKKIHNFCNNPFTRTRKLIYKGQVKIYKTIIVQSKALPAFTELLKVWYSDKKTLPEDLEKYFNTETLAYWYMDDGYIHIKERSSDIIFCTDSFTKDEVIRLINILNSKFDLDAKLYANKNSYRIRIGFKDKIQKFKELVKPYILDSMLYKIRDCN